MSAFDDYLQLLNNNPKMDATKLWVNKLGKNVKTGIEDNLPKGTDPTAMLDWASANNPISHAASMIGSIRKKIDTVVTDNELEHWIPDSFDKKWIKYFKTNWATDNDQLVKYVDEGGNIGPRLHNDDDDFVSNTHMGNTYEITPDYRHIDNIAQNLSGGKITESKLFDHKKFNMNSESTTIASIINGLQSNTATIPELKHVYQIQKLADYFRKIAGTNQVAKTEAGKYFENANDIKAAASNRTGEIPDKLFDYTDNNPEQNIFYPDIPSTFAGMEGGTSLPNKLPDNINNMSLQEIVRRATKYDMDMPKYRYKLFKSKGAKDITKMHKFDDGTSWNLLNSKKSMNAEACMQNNCLESKNRTPTQDFYSLRSDKNEPILTLQYNPITSKMDSIQARFNGNNGFEDDIAKYSTHTKTLLDLLGKK